MPQPQYWFTSDTHFGHKAIIKPEYDNRPFATIEEHDEHIISQWNSFVSENDIVIHCGDFSFHNTKITESIIDRLNGKKRLFRGNHDKIIDKRLEHLFESVEVAGIVKAVDPRTGKVHKVYCSHNPHLVWTESHYGVPHVHGHCHGSIQEKWNVGFRRFDVGINLWDYKPVNLSEILFMSNRIIPVQVDHHKIQLPTLS